MDCLTARLRIGQFQSDNKWKPESFNSKILSFHYKTLLSYADVLAEITCGLVPLFAQQQEDLVLQSWSQGVIDQPVLLFYSGDDSFLIYNTSGGAADWKCHGWVSVEHTALMALCIRPEQPDQILCTSSAVSVQRTVRGSWWQLEFNQRRFFAQVTSYFDIVVFHREHFENSPLMRDSWRWKLL